MFVAAACLVTLIQLVAVTMAALPPNRYSDAVRPEVSYLEPYFAQNWRLFAPNPVAQDRNVLFQGTYRDAKGRIELTPWLDWTAIELDLVHHRLVGGRAGYITNKMFGPLASTAGRLSSEQRAVSLGTDRAAPPTWAEFRNELVDLGDNPANVTTYLRYERAAVQLATDALQARWPERKFVAVRYALLRQDVVPYADRNKPEREREAARPDATRTPSGWRPASPGGAAERRVVTDFYRRHR